MIRVDSFTMYVGHSHVTAFVVLPCYHQHIHNRSSALHDRLTDSSITHHCCVSLGGPVLYIVRLYQPTVVRLETAMLSPICYHQTVKISQHDWPPPVAHYLLVLHSNKTTRFEIIHSMGSDIHYFLSTVLALLVIGNSNSLYTHIYDNHGNSDPRS